MDVGDQAELHRGGSFGVGGFFGAASAAELGGSPRGGVNGVDQGTRTPAQFERMKARDGCSPRRGNLVLENSGVQPRVAHHPGGTEHGLRGEEGGHITRQTRANPAVGKGLDHQINKGWSTAGEPGDGIEQWFGDSHRTSDRIEKRLDHRFVIGSDAGTQRIGRCPLADQGRRIGHHADDPGVGRQSLCDRGNRDPRGHRHHQLLAINDRADLMKNGPHALGFDGEHDNVALRHQG